MEVLEAYLFLMQSRNQAALTIEIQIETTLYDRFIPTLTLQIITENCFKHNAMTTVKQLHISIISIENDYISIRNNRQLKLTTTKISGHGLDNIRERYDLLGIKNGIKIQQNDDFFEVQLKLI